MFNLVKEGGERDCSLWARLSLADWLKRASGFYIVDLYNKHELQTTN